MWIEVKKANSLMVAEMWQDLFEGEGVPARILPASGVPISQEFTEYSVMVPKDKEHVIRDVLKKL
ncbi:MAG: hypothetical protein WBC50_02480 [Dehalococcoidales bacterium]